jgi:hypothetical protein
LNRMRTPSRQCEHHRGANRSKLRIDAGRCARRPLISTNFSTVSVKIESAEPVM